MRSLVILVVILGSGPGAHAGLDCEEADDLKTLERFARRKLRPDHQEVDYMRLCLSGGCTTRVPGKAAREREVLACIAQAERLKPRPRLLEACDPALDEADNPARTTCAQLLGLRGVTRVRTHDVVAILLAADLHDHISSRPGGGWVTLDALMIVADSRIAPALVTAYRAALTRETRANRWVKKELRGWRLAVLGVLWRQADATAQPLVDEILATEKDREVLSAARALRTRLAGRGPTPP